MRQDEAERLARKMRSETFLPRGADPVVSGQDLRALCDHILSGDMRREIENAAYERAALESEANGNYRRHNEMYGESAGLKSDAATWIAKRIRSLIQPPAQKEKRK